MVPIDVKMSQFMPVNLQLLRRFPFCFQNDEKSGFELWFAPSTFGVGCPGPSQNTSRIQDKKVYTPMSISIIIIIYFLQAAAGRGHPTDLDDFRVDPHRSYW